MHIVMYCNGGPEIGFGHVLRCSALAEESLQRGHRVTFAGRFESRFLAAQLHRLGVDVWHDLSPQEAVCSAPDVLHLDTYDQIQVPPGRRGVVISSMEDGPFGRRTATLAIDPNLGAETEERPDLGAQRLLRGPRYVPLRKAVTRWRGEWRPSCRPPRVLVVMGGTDPLGLAPEVLEAIRATDVTPEVVTVVAPERLRGECRSAAGKLSVEIRGHADNLPELIVQHDVVVSAAGTSAWELCCLGAPMGLLCAVENQRVGYTNIVKAGGAIGLGSAPVGSEEVRAKLTRLLTDNRLRLDMSRRAQRLVDGHGASRIVSAWEQMTEPCT